MGTHGRESESSGRYEDESSVIIRAGGGVGGRRWVWQRLMNWYLPHFDCQNTAKNCQKNGLI
jgi:hypothetical protein